jgi:hypothetical protein
MSEHQPSQQSSQTSIDKCATCLGEGEIGTENGPVSCPDCFGEGRRLALAERVEWRMRDIERAHRGDTHGCARDMNWLVFELRRSREALQQIMARCQDEDDAQPLAAEIKFVANQILELYEPRR